ncbi:MAG: hypothetical protein ACRCX2_21970, partial [Paraclostridium sp.]
DLLNLLTQSKMTETEYRSAIQSDNFKLSENITSRVQEFYEDVVPYYSLQLRELFREPLMDIHVSERIEFNDGLIHTHRNHSYEGLPLSRLGDIIFNELYSGIGNKVDTPLVEFEINADIRIEDEKYIIDIFKTTTKGWLQLNSLFLE